MADSDESKETRPTDQGEGGASDQEQVLAEWRLHLFGANVARSTGAAVACAAALVLVHLAFQSLWLTILAGLILVGSLSDWLFPITYRLTTHGAGYRNFIFKKRIAWRDVKSTYMADFGVKLSPFSHRSRLDVFRGVVLRFASDEGRVPGNRDDVVRIVKERAAKR